MSERAHEGQDYKKKLAHDVIGGVATADPQIQVEEGDYVQARFTRRGELRTSIDGDINLTTVSNSEGLNGSAPPSYSQLAGGTATTNAPAYGNNQIRPLSLETDGDLRTVITDAQAASDAAAPSQVLMVGALANAAAPTPDEGDIYALSTDLTSGLRTRVDLAQGTQSATAPSQILMQGQYAETTVPTAVSDTEAVRPWYDEYGRPIAKETDLSQQAQRVTDIAPATTQKLGPITFTQLTDQGATAATNVRNYKYINAHVVAASITASAEVRLEGSHDNSNWFPLPLLENDVTNFAVNGGEAVISAAGTYCLQTPAVSVEYVRFNYFGGGSPNNSTYDVSLMAGN
jgi:hypothetical protein